MATKTDKTPAEREDDDDRVIKNDADDEAEEIFTDLRDNRSHVEVPDDAQDALDELSEALGVDDDDDTPDTPEDGADPDDKDDGKDEEEDAAALEAQANGRAEAARKDLFERKKTTLQVIAAQAETLDAKEVNAKSMKASAERVIAGYTDRMKALKEAGDTDGEIALQQEGLDARDNLRAADTSLAQIAKDRPVLLDRLKQTGWNGKSFDETDADKAEIAKVSGKTTPQGDGVKKPSKHSDAFVKANAWMSDPKYAGQRTLLLAMDAALRAEGKIDVDDPKYFPTLTQRFNRVPKDAGGMPGLIKDIGGKPVATGARERGRGRGGAMPSGGLGSLSEGDEGARGGKVTLTSLDLRTMRSFGMDPNSPKDRKSFLSEKIADVRATTGRA